MVNWTRNRYYEYRDSGAFEREDNGFPTILVVTTRPAAERRIAGVARRLAYGRAAPLPMLVTCTWRIEASPDGMLGKVWRTPMAEERRLWLSESSAKSLARKAR